MADTAVMENVEQKRAILDGLLDIVGDGGLAEVKVVDLCRRCGVSRATFYRLFTGVRGVATWYREYTAAIGTYQIGRSLTCREGHLVSLSMLKRAKPIYMRLSRWGDFDFSTPSVSLHTEVMAQVLSERGAPQARRTPYVLEGVAACCNTVVTKWFNEGCALPVPELVDVIVGFYPDELRRVFDNPPHPVDVGPLLRELLG